MTHCFELYHEITKKVKDIEGIECHYTADGLEAVIKDNFDGQQYTLTIKPKN